MVTGKTGRGSWIIGWAAAVCLLHASTSWAIYLDKDQKVSIRGRVYSQWSIRAADSPDTPNVVSQANPSFKAGQLVQQRNFYNPEIDANLTEYTTWMRDLGWLNWMAPDDFGFRVAAWGFYDGIYDYGSGQYGAAASAPRVVSQGAQKPFLNSFGPAWFPLPDQVADVSTAACDNPNGCVVGTLFTRSDKIPDLTTTRALLVAGVPLENVFEPTSAREVYAQQQRVNELYLNYSKGPLFVRLGRQSISWGEADTIALLDANNPFDITLGVPGIFEDLDEARIPLWTLRSSYQLFSSLGPFSSGFIEAYWVPGNIDQHFAYAPSPLGVSAYGPTGLDPHLQLIGGVIANPIMPLPPASANRAGDATSIVLVDLEPEKEIKNSRGGVRFETIVDREHTLSGWWYRTYNNAPIARLVSPPSSQDVVLAISQGRPAMAVSSTERADIDVFGIADTFFLEPLDSIMRFEAEYFLNELSFLDWRPAPDPNNPQPASLTAPEAIRQMANIPQDGTTNYDKPSPRTNHLRFEVGLDRFMFIRFLNPTNSFVIAGSVVGDYNIDATVNKRYGFGPGRPTKPFEGFLQVTTQTDYMHGRLQPRLTAIYNLAGAYAFNATANYRVTDYLILGLQYAIIDGDFHQIGFFRNYDQVALRATFQLN